MAEVLVNIAGAVLNNLGALLGQEIGLLWGLGDELGKLQDTVSTIRAVLHDAEKLSRTDEAAKEWLHDLKDAVYDADDLLDDISTEVLRRQLKSGNEVVKEVRLFFSSSNRLAYGLKMAHKVKAIRERLDGIADKRKKFHLKQNIVEQAFEMNHDRDTHSCAPAVVIGRKDDKKKLVSLLLDGHEKNLVVISIVGLGGLGKTTLAQMVYDDEKVIAHFDLKVWVCVSNNFDVKSIVQKMMECIDKKRPNENHGMEALKSQLHERVKGKKCLFVLDDIWNEEREKWVPLTDLIACVAPGSIILVTTRSKTVAEITGALITHELEGLSQRESWDLFQKVAFNEGRFPNPEFEELGKEIAEGCRGFPLAIRAIGSLLYTKKRESEWQHFKDGEFSKLDPKVNILKTLELSYNYLPSKLKPCFAYCSLFPKDYVIDVYRLISYWKAQGYVGSKTEGSSSQDDGLNCFMFLVQRSFFQIEEETEDGKIFTCRMHDFMHDLAMSVAGEEVKILGYGISDGATVTGKTRHMSLHEVSDEEQLRHVAPLLQGKKARTLIFQCPYLDLDEECLSMIIDELRCLRVLSLEKVMFKKLPNNIDKLKHLRQLDLSWNLSIEMLSDTVTRLHNLQELNMDGCMALKKLPRDMEKLVNLVILGLKGCHDLEEMPRGIGKLTSLEVLSQFNLGDKRRHATGRLDELEKLNKLKGKLKLRNLQRVKKGALECEVANLKEKPHLRSLTLEWGYLHEVEDMTNEEKSLEALQPHGNLRKLKLKDYRGERFPEWIPFLQNLVEIKMVNCGNCKYLPSLDGLPSLKCLLVDRLQWLEYMIDNSRNTKIADASCFFPILETLFVWNCPKLKGWWSTEELWSREEQSPLHCSLPWLFQLDIYGCPNLKGWMPKLPSLKDIELAGVSTGLFEETLKKAIPPSTSTGTQVSPPLQSLYIEDIIDLGVLHEAALQNLASLKSLHIRSTDTRVLSPWLYHLTALERLKISFCEETNLFEENNTEFIQPLELINLRSLELFGCKNMKCLPRRFQYLTALEELVIDGCEELESMPTWVRNLTSLKRLYIFGCPLLRERCGSNQGEDWPSISHIPHITVDRTQIQLNGSYQL